MKHYGDIKEMHGDAIPVVDVITGGSPCQDLSVAGKRAGLAGERSGLFMEQVRVVKEMREADVQRTGRSGFLVRPRYMVWENVPGCLSSGDPKGGDFQAVLQEVTGLVFKEAPPVPIPKDGWPKAGCISGVGDSGCTFSIAWRIHDAQFWGVPQRRKRLALVADFGGLSAPEILFERKGLRGNPQEGGEEGQGTSGGTEESTGKPNAYGISAFNSNAMKSNNPHSGVYKAETSRTLDLNGGTPACNQGGVAVVHDNALNKWDVQSKHIQSRDGIAEALYEGECRYGGGESYVFDGG